MQVIPINNSSTNFGWLETYSVSHPKSKALVKAELSELKELGKKYNIYLRSQDLNGNEWLEACVSELNSRPILYPINGYRGRRSGRDIKEVTDSISVSSIVWNAIHKI